MSDFLTVREVADAAGVSVQAIYSRLDKDLKPFVNLVDGKKRLDKTVLRLFEKRENESKVVNNNQELINLLKQQNEVLQRELEAKTEQLQAKDRQIDALTAALQASQALQAGALRQLPEPEVQEPMQPPRRHWWQRRKGT